MIALTWTLAVFGLMYSRRPISALVAPGSEQPQDVELARGQPVRRGGLRPASEGAANSRSCRGGPAARGAREPRSPPQRDVALGGRVGGGELGLGVLALADVEQALGQPPAGVGSVVRHVVPGPDVLGRPPRRLLAVAAQPGELGVERRRRRPCPERPRVAGPKHSASSARVGSSRASCSRSSAGICVGEVGGRPGGESQHPVRRARASARPDAGPSPRRSGPEPTALGRCHRSAAAPISASQTAPRRAEVAESSTRRHRQAALRSPASTSSSARTGAAATRAS